MAAAAISFAFGKTPAMADNRFLLVRASARSQKLTLLPFRSAQREKGEGGGLKVRPWARGMLTPATGA
jgi:hypothetical protein